MPQGVPAGTLAYCCTADKDGNNQPVTTYSLFLSVPSGSSTIWVPVGSTSDADIINATLAQVPNSISLKTYSRIYGSGQWVLPWAISNKIGIILNKTDTRYVQAANPLTATALYHGQITGTICNTPPPIVVSNDDHDPSSDIFSGASPTSFAHSPLLQFYSNYGGYLATQTSYGGVFSSSNPDSDCPFYSKYFNSSGGPGVVYSFHACRSQHWVVTHGVGAWTDTATYKYAQTSCSTLKPSSTLYRFVEIDPYIRDAGKKTEQKYPYWLASYYSCICSDNVHLTFDYSYTRTWKPYLGLLATLAYAAGNNKLLLQAYYNIIYTSGQPLPQIYPGVANYTTYDTYFLNNLQLTVGR